jgi:hypothetical protein
MSKLTPLSKSLTEYGVSLISILGLNILAIHIIINPTKKDARKYVDVFMFL